MVRENKVFGVLCSVFRENTHDSCPLPPRAAGTDDWWKMIAFSTNRVHPRRKVAGVWRHNLKRLLNGQIFTSSPNTEHRTPNTFLRTLAYLAVVLGLCVMATGCGRRAAAPAPADHRPPAADLRTPPSAQAAAVPTAIAPPPQPPTAQPSSVVTSLPPSTIHPPPSTLHPPPSSLHPPPSTLHLPPSTSDLRSTARQVSTLVRTADEAVRASPAGSQAWANVIQLRAAYSDVLKQDAQYRELTARLARIEDIAATNAPGEAEEVGAAMAQRERTLLRDVPEAARARAAAERAESVYGALVQADARYVESVRLIKTMGTNEAQAKASQQAVEKGIRP